MEGLGRKVDKAGNKEAQKWWTEEKEEEEEEQEKEEGRYRQKNKGQKSISGTGRGAHRGGGGRCIEDEGWGVGEWERER